MTNWIVFLFLIKVVLFVALILVLAKRKKAISEPDTYVRIPLDLYLLNNGPVKEGDLIEDIVHRDHGYFHKLTEAEAYVFNNYAELGRGVYVIIYKDENS